MLNTGHGRLRSIVAATAVDVVWLTKWQNTAATPRLLENVPMPRSAQSVRQTAHNAKDNHRKENLNEQLEAEDLGQRTTEPV